MHDKFIVEEFLHYSDSHKLLGDKPTALEYIIERIQLNYIRDEYLHYRDSDKLLGDKPTALFPSTVETDPSLYTRFMRAAVGQLVALYFEGGDYQVGILHSVENTGKVTLTKVLDDNGWHSNTHDAFYPAMSLEFHNAYLIEVRSDSAKAHHIKRYKESPVANVGRMMTGFTEYLSYTGIVVRADPYDDVVLSNVLCSSYRLSIGHPDFLLRPGAEFACHPSLFTDGLKWHEQVEVAAHKRRTKIAEQDPEKYS